MLSKIVLNIFEIRKLNQHSILTGKGINHLLNKTKLKKNYNHIEQESVFVEKE